MIAKCIAILAIVAQINANVCQQRTLIGSSLGSSSGRLLVAEATPIATAQIAAAPMATAQIAAAPMATAQIAAAPVATVAVQSSGLSGLGSASGLGSGSGSGAITKNIVAKGKYPVALSNCGPTPDRQIPVTFSHSTAPLQEKPTVPLPARIPEQRTIAHSCTCYKTIVKPRVHNHIVTVPSVERYIETGHTPVIENIHYEAEPVNCRDQADNRFYFVNANGQGQALGSSLIQPASQSVQLLSAAPAQQVLVQNQASQMIAASARPAIQSVELLSSSAPIRQAAQAVELISAPLRQASQMIAASARPAIQSVELLSSSAPIRQAAQTVELVSAPIRQAAQSVELISAPIRQAAQSVELVSAPIRQAAQTVELVSAPLRQAPQLIAASARPAIQSVELLSSSAPALQVSSGLSLASQRSLC